MHKQNEDHPTRKTEDGSARPFLHGRRSMPSQLGHQHHISMLDKKIIAFAPPTEDVDEVAEIDDELDALLPVHFPHRGSEVSDHNVRLKNTKGSDASKAKPPRPSKNPLPKPYRNQRTEMQKRKAMQTFVYGKDEEFEFSDKDLRVPTPCCGILFFHTIELLELIVNKQSFVDNIPVSYYCLLSIGQMKRSTKIVHALKSHQVKIDSHVHLSIDVSEIRDAPLNKLRIELWSFQDPEAHFIVGTVELHIYNFIRVQHVIDSTHLWSDGIKVGKLAYEVAFSYGVYGYGHSNQLKNFAHPIMEIISHSMFPRIRLDEKADLADRAFQARRPDKLKLFTYHSLILEVDQKDPWSLLGSRKAKKAHIDVEPKPIVVHQVEFEGGFPAHCRLHMNIWQKVMQPDFNDMYGEYVCIGHKRGRLEYLAAMVQGRMRDRFEEETGTLFRHLKPREIDEIHNTQFVPGEMIYPKMFPCPTSAPFKLQPEDEEFQNKLPALRRESGYLAKLFGYEEPPKPSEFLNDMDYPAFKEAQVPKKKSNYKSLKDWIVERLRRIWTWIKLKAILIFNYIFPEEDQELQVPEISVTVASPEGSTTDIYSYFAREFRDPVANKKLRRLVQQTTALLDLARKHHHHLKDGDDDSSEEENEEEEEEIIG